MKRYFFIFLAILCASVSFSQEKQEVSDDFESPKLVIKTNALYWLTTTPNLSVETLLSDKMSLDILACWNPWKLGEYARFQVFVIQPEVRYWLGKPMKGHFIGSHAHYVHANVGLIDATVIGTPINFRLSFLPLYRKKGDIYGVGVSYGYSWLLGTKWRLEGVVSLGYAHMQYDTYTKYGSKIARDYYNYVGPTKLGVNFVYVIK